MDIVEEKQILPWAKVYNNIFSCSYQTFLGYLCLDACVAISLHFVANEIGELENAGLGLAYACVFLTINPIAFGINQSLNIHTAQALGQDKVPLAKVYLTLNVYMILLFMIPASLILYALKYPLSFTIPADERQATSDSAWELLIYVLPAMILAMEFEGFKTFMVAHQVVYPFTIIHVVTTASHYFTNWLFISYFQLGIKGAGFAIIITEVLNLLGLLLFVVFSDLKRTVFGGVSLKFNLGRRRRLAWAYIRTSFPIIVHIFSEYFIFFLLSFIALSLDTYQMNAHLAIQNTSGICFRIPISLQLALMSYVGNEMGKLNITNAKRYTVAGLVIMAVSTAILVALLLAFSESWAYFYTANDHVKDILLDVLPWMTFSVIILDGFQGTINGALKGIEKQKLVTYSALIAYYLVCAPLVVYFTYPFGLDRKVKGIWQAFGISNAVLSLLYIWAMLSANWYRQAEKIQARVIKQAQMHSATLQQRKSLKSKSVVEEEEDDDIFIEQNFI